MNWERGKPKPEQKNRNSVKKWLPETEKTTMEIYNEIQKSGEATHEELAAVTSLSGTWVRGLAILGFAVKVLVIYSLC